MHVLELQQTQRVRGRKSAREHGPRPAPCMSAPVSPPPLPVRVRGGTTLEVVPPRTQTGGQTAPLTSECALSCVSGSIMPTCTTEAEGERVQHTRNKQLPKPSFPDHFVHSHWPWKTNNLVPRILSREGSALIPPLPAAGLMAAHSEQEGFTCTSLANQPTCTCIFKLYLYTL